VTVNDGKTARVVDDAVTTIALTVHRVRGSSAPSRRALVITAVPPIPRATHAAIDVASLAPASASSVRP
jgi:hypothetical protein